MRYVQYENQNLRAVEIELLRRRGGAERFLPFSRRLFAFERPTMRRIFLAIIIILISQLSAMAQNQTLQSLLMQQHDAIAKPSRGTAEALITAALRSGAPEANAFLEKWRSREVWLRKSDGQFFLVKPDGDHFQLLDIASGAVTGSAQKNEVDQIKPNSGVQAVVSSALVQFQLSDKDRQVRSDALSAIEKDPQAGQLGVLRASIGSEADSELKTRKTRLERLLTLRFDPEPKARVAAIESFAGDTHVDVRSALNPILATTLKVVASIPSSENVAKTIVPGQDITVDAAYDMLVAAQLAPSSITEADRDTALAANLKDGRVGGMERDALNTTSARDQAYEALVKAGSAKPTVRATARAEAVGKFKFYESYNESSAQITAAAYATVSAINSSVRLNEIANLVLDAISLASIYFLAAIGLAITFGVMRVINMAHGEFIMIGAYTGYVVQQWVSNYTVSIIIALPLAFIITFAAGVALERLVIRRLINRPLETLLATFGISIALQQIAKNIFGTQARPLTSPDWLGGSLHFNDIISISYIRIAIFILALIFLTLLLFMLNKTRLGLEVRAVTQNRRMAASMGINPDRINMLTFGLGSGIAGIAGVAIGLYAQVTSEIGSNYIVMSFMAVVVGGVGNVWGTLAGAGLTGMMQKFIEWFNPSNTLAAQTFMIIFIIIFIQFRPRGIIALKGRAAGA